MSSWYVYAVGDSYDDQPHGSGLDGEIVSVLYAADEPLQRGVLAYRLRSAIAEALAELGFRAASFEERGILELSDAAPGSTVVLVRMPGALYYRLHDTSWPDEQPEAWDAIVGGQRVRRGRGFTIHAWLPTEAALDLALYLESVVDVVGSMSREERGAEDVRLEARVAEAIRASLAESSASGTMTAGSAAIAEGGGS